MTPTKRILRSRFVLALYEHGLGEPDSSVEDVMAMIAREVESLEDIAVIEPRRAETLAKLVARWRGFGDRLKIKAN